MLLKTLAELLEKSMKALSKAMKSDEAAAESSVRPVSEKVQKLLDRATYEPPKVISFPTQGITSISPLSPVTMMANL
jgi:hypothetical protein